MSTLFFFILHGNIVKIPLNCFCSRIKSIAVSSKIIPTLYVSIFQKNIKKTNNIDPLGNFVVANVSNWGNNDEGLEMTYFEKLKRHLPLHKKIPLRVPYRERKTGTLIGSLRLSVCTSLKTLFLRNG